MKSIFVKDKIYRHFLKYFNKKYFLLKLIIKNKNFFILLRFQCYKFFKFLSKFNFLFLINKKCYISFSKRCFNKNTFYSRSVFLKKIQNAEINGFKK